MRGLQTHFGIDAQDYLDYVHDLPLEDYLDPDPELGSLLNSLPQKCWIFTNADADHARRVLERLTIQDCFAGIIDVLAMDFVCKPDPVAYQRALKTAAVKSVAQCMLFDDTERNLIPARRLGFSTVRVGAQAGPNQEPGSPEIIDAESANPNSAGEINPGAASFLLPDIHLLHEYLPLLWDGD
jgi:HAD superfamily hydrolase (TIGR01509 family)